MSESTGNRRDLIVHGISLLGVVVLSFLSGAFVAEFKLFPYDLLLERPFEALRARVEKTTRSFRPDQNNWWTPLEQEGRTGVTVRNPDKMFEGYTAYAAVEPKVRLINSEGEEVFRWKKSFSSVWKDPPHIRDPVPERAIRITSFRIFDNGHALLTYTAQGDTPYGYGMIKVDENSNLLWKYPGHVHHDFHVNDDGSIWALVHYFRDLPKEKFSELPKRFHDRRVLEDAIVRLSTKGEERKRFPLTEIVMKSELGELVGEWHNGVDWDLLHTNNVEPVPSEFAEHHSFANPGDLLVSFREIDTIGLVDPEEKRLTWYARGLWVKQHDPDPLANGHILLFDNLGNQGPEGRARVIEFDPDDGNIVWEYSGTRSDQFATGWGGKQTVLPNGNILVVETLGGRLFEVTRDKEIVWEFYNTIQTTYKDKTYIGAIPGGHQRLTPEQAEFLR